MDCPVNSRPGSSRYMSRGASSWNSDAIPSSVPCGDGGSGLLPPHPTISRRTSANKAAVNNSRRQIAHLAAGLANPAAHRLHLSTAVIDVCLVMFHRLLQVFLAVAAVRRRHDLLIQHPEAKGKLRVAGLDLA